MEASEVLPVTEELLFLYYTDGADHMDEECKNEVHGFAFYYPTLGLCKIIEVEVETTECLNDVLEFKRLLC